MAPVRLTKSNGNKLGAGCLSIAQFMLTLNLSGVERPFDDFHSNLGEIVQIRTQGKLDQFSSKTPNSERPPSTEPETELTDEEIENLLFGDLFQEQPGEVEPHLEPLSPWFNSLTIESAVGYSDNPLYGNYHPEGSPYTMIGLEAFSLRQGNPRRELLLYLFAEGKKFSDLGDEDLAGMVLGMMDYSFSPEQNFLGYGLRLQHTYYDQGMDFSEIDLPYRMKVTSNRSAIHPRLEWRADDHLLGVFKLGWEREVYRKIKDESEDLQVSLSLTGALAERWEWSTDLKGEKTRYKHRRPKEGDGTELTGKLRGESVETSLSLEYSHMDERLEKTGMKISYKNTADDSGSYYDYNRWKLTLSQGISLHPWSIDLTGGFGDVRYTDRKTSEDENLDRKSWNFDLVIAREIGKHWAGFIKWNHEKENSNDASFEYDSNFWTIGMSWEK